MGRIIDRDKIRKGDKILVKYAVEVGTDPDADGDFKTASGDWFELDYNLGREVEVEVELLERATPELPTERGKFITVFRNSGNEGDTGYWMTQEDGFLVSSRNVRKSRDEFLDWIHESDRSFEVLDSGSDA